MDSGFYGIMFVSNVFFTKRPIQVNFESGAMCESFTLLQQSPSRHSLTHMMASSSVLLSSVCAEFTCTEFNSPSGSEYLCVRNEIN